MDRIPFLVLMIVVEHIPFVSQGKFYGESPAEQVSGIDYDFTPSSIVLVIVDLNWTRVSMLHSIKWNCDCVFL